MKPAGRIARLLETDIRDLFKQGRLVDEQFLVELEAILLHSDLATGAVREIIENVRESHSGHVVQLADVVSVIRDGLN